MEQVDRFRDNAMKFTDAATMDHRGITLAKTLAIFSSLSQIYSFFFSDGGSRHHKGSDVVCAAGAVIRAPFKGRVRREVIPYGTGVCVDNGFEFESTDNMKWPGENYFDISIKIT